MLKKLSEGFLLGVGFVLSIVLLFGIAIAFVEPGSSPGTNYMVDSASPIAANFSQLRTLITAVNSTAKQKIILVGYTSSATNGNLTRIKGANSLCNSTYPNSRAMTYWDWIAMDPGAYNYTYDVWLIDGSYVTESSQYARDGSASDTTGYTVPQCSGWYSAAAGHRGPTLDTAGRNNFESCTNSLRLACVR